MLKAADEVAQGRRVSDGEYFDALAERQGEFDPFAARGWNTLRRRFAEALESRSDCVLLDVGCGTGHSHQIYAGLYGGYVGVDLSLRSLRLASRHRPEVSWIQSDALHLPFDDESFDVVAFSSVLHHIDDRVAALREARRLLKPSGFVFAFDPNLLHPAMALFRHPRSPLYISAGVSPNERPLLGSELREAFLKAGFTEVSQRGQADIPYRSVAPPLINACLGIYNAADRVLAMSGLDRWFGSFVVSTAHRDAAV